jgi:diaminohydroxyphosphoribosylaminopyrimidine deaminase/5-amino-6-(5-phosphoribosylamino)uracil reductase
MSRPHVTLKLATSLDGRIATASGESRWITGEAARAEVHRMRANADAVMIGAGTARTDDPSLLARTEPPPARQPTRVVISAGLDLSPTGKLFAHLDRSPLLIIGTGAADPARMASLEAAGALVQLVDAALGAGVNLPAALQLLASAGLACVLVEGGGELAASLVSANLIDRLEWMRGPIVLGAEGKPAIGPLGLERFEDAPRWRRVALRELGPDLWESYDRV